MSVTCDPSTLANLARCFNDCIPPGLQAAVQAYLLCQIAAAGGTGGGGTGAPEFFAGNYANSTPTDTPTTSVAFAVDTSGSHPTWMWYSAAWHRTGMQVDGTKVWKGIISQAGLNAPTTDFLLENTLGNGVWSRNGDGDYVLTFPFGVLPDNKAIVMIGSPKDTDHYVIARPIGGDAISVMTVDTTSTPFSAAVDSMNNTPLEIRVWP